jgi:hypothetical protein
LKKPTGFSPLIFPENHVAAGTPADFKGAPRVVRRRALKDLVNRELLSRKSRTVYQRSISQNYAIPAMTFHARELIPEPVFPKEK